ncbi:hypothetical protein P7B02_04185 [Caulobacter segnis]|uniref:hypothetical protein n=1 Tax=Caulobacter segnis TaxID=88688 RepID=UPI00240FA38F|nr:hypothetical protein [Caulobacter segnis]MDG2520732.1 hypothetical protein [Caulobacter segnis]
MTMLLCALLLAADLSAQHPAPPAAKEEPFSARRLMELQASKRATRSPAVGLDAAEAARINQMRIEAVGKKVQKSSEDGSRAASGSGGSGPR